MRAHPRAALPLLALLLGACVDFEDPSGLRIARNTVITVQLSLSDAPLTVCQGPGPWSPVQPGENVATLCLEATVRPGRDSVGNRAVLAEETLVAMGRPIEPVLGNDSVRVYQAGFRIPVDLMSDTVYTVTLPRIEGVELPVQGMRWRAVEPLGPDTVRRAPGEGAHFRLALPLGVSEPAPTSNSWLMRVPGAAATAQYLGFEFPRPAYDFPAEVLAGLGGSRFPAEFSWNRSWSRTFREQRVQLSLFFSESLRWTIEAEEPAAAAPLSSGSGS